MVVVVMVMVGEEGQKKSFQRRRASQKRKMYVLQDSLINNTVTSECRWEQWHCVEKRWRILLSFFSQTALSINYFYVFIYYFIPFQRPEWFLIARGDAVHHVRVHRAKFGPCGQYTVRGHQQLKVTKYIYSSSVFKYNSEVLHMCMHTFCPTLFI